MGLGVGRRGKVKVLSSIYKNSYLGGIFGALLASYLSLAGSLSMMNSKLLSIFPSNAEKCLSALFLRAWQSSWRNFLCTFENPFL